jgi:hypothetical protein
MRCPGHRARLAAITGQIWTAIAGIGRYHHLVSLPFRRRRVYEMGIRKGRV